jgi:sialate O-acetylesterase
MMKKYIYLFTGLLLLFFCPSSEGKVIVSRLISNNMVLQRRISTRIWGTANPQEKITIEFKGRRYQTRSSKDGAWLIMLAPAEAGGPFMLTIKGWDEVLKINNLLVGDVWVYSGQSNMEFSVSGVFSAAKELAAATDSGIRQFKVPKANADVPASLLSGGEWKSSSPATTAEFTAVGYFFARETRKVHPGVPIGLINASWGGNWAAYA